MPSGLIVTFVLAFVCAAAATPLVRAFARRIGAVAAPKKDRWHKAPTAMMGGVAIYIATMAALLTLLPWGTQSLVVVIASTALFAVGLIDDFLHLKPYQKLIGQLLGAAAVIYFGLVLPWTGWPVLNMAITLLWLVGVTNAVNMLDNMDGLSVGVAAIASLALAVNFFLNGQTAEALMLSAFCGALCGFLIYNHNPASIFMGDCGSLFVGFFLASAALLASQGGGGRSRSVVAVLAVPVLVLCIPIFDTTFVTLMRKMAGRAASQGGRDHTSHRLVALGLSERHAVWMLYAFAAMGGVLSIAVRQLDLDVSVAVIAGFAIALAIVGVHLGGVRVYNEDEIAAAQRKPVVSFLIDLSYKRRIFEVLLDVALIALAQYAAYFTFFGRAVATSSDWQLFLKTLPIIIFVKLGVFLAAGMYRGLWRYASVSDLFTQMKAVFGASVASVMAVLFAFRFDGFSRAVFIADGAFLLLFVVSSRFAFRALRRLIPAPHTRTGRRVIVFGAGDAGDLLYREMHNNHQLGFVPVAFVDDDERKIGRKLHGLRVYSTEALADVCREVRADEVFLSTMKVPLSRLRHIVETCESAGVPVKRMRLEIERVADRELGWVTSGGPLEPSAADTAVVPLLVVEKSRKGGRNDRRDAQPRP